jgi:hypothetical protein
MKSEKHDIALVGGIGLGVVKSRNSHYAVIEFNDGKHKWEIVAYNGEYDIVSDISIGLEEIE